MRLRIDPLADQEVVESAKYYEERNYGWGDRFLQEFELALRSILEAPERWPIREFGFRKYTMQEFAHTIRYIERPDHLYVIAVPHSSRKPGYWKNRISDEQR